MESGLSSPREREHPETINSSLSRAKLRQLLVANKAIIHSSPQLRQTYYKVHERLEKQRKVETEIYLNSLDIGTSYAHATGGELIDETGFQALHEAGYTAYPAIAVPLVFESWQDFQDHIKTDYDEEVAEKEKLKASLVQGLECEVKSGSLPKIFTKALHRGKSLEKALETSDGKIDNDVGFFDKEKASKDEKALRYARLLVIRKLYPMVLVENTTSARRTEQSHFERTISIALKANLRGPFYSTVHEGKIIRAYKLLSTMHTELAKSDSSLQSGDIEKYVETTPFYDILYPSVQQEYFNQLKRVVQ